MAFRFHLLSALAAPIKEASVRRLRRQSSSGRNHVTNDAPVRQDGWPQASSDASFIGAAYLGRTARLTTHLATLLLLCLTLTGCTTGRHGGEAAGGSPGAGNSADNKTLRIPLVTEPAQTDPAKSQDIVTGEMLEHIFEGLVRFNEKNEAEPALAEKWDISSDGNTYTFHLRQNATFHNGRPFVADDVIYSWKHALAPKTASGVAAGYLDGVLGVKEVAAGKATEIAGVKALDPHTLQVQIDHPRAYFLGMMAYPSNYVLCKEAVEANGGIVDAKSMTGTGPFKLESYQPGNEVVLTANPNYWGGKPTLDRIEQKIIIDPETLYNNFQSGAIDAWMTSIPASRYAQDRDAGKFKAEWHSLSTGETTYLAFQQDRQPVFKNKLVRQAFALAIDRNKIFHTAFNGLGTQADGFLPAAMPLRGTPPAPYPFDPTKAKQLLAQAGYPDGKGFPAITLTYQEKAPTYSATGQLVQADLKNNLGISLTLQELEAGQYFDQEHHKQMEFYIGDWIADYPDPQDFLSLLFVSNASLNRTGYHNTAFDQLCAQADQDSDNNKRAELYGRANALLTEDAAIIPLVYPPRLVLVHTNVQGWKANILNVLPFKDVTIQR